MKFKAILNREGGTFSTTDMVAYEKHLRQIMAAHGHDIEICVVSGAKTEAAMTAAARSDKIDAMIVGGGDGTISTAAAVAWKNGMPLGIIPAGTMNLFARSLGMPLDIWDAADWLATGALRDNDIGSCNEHAFIHQFSAGLHARMIRMRNQIEYNSRAGKLAANIRAAGAALLDPPAFRVRCIVDGTTLTREVSAISISANPFGESPLLVTETRRSGRLGVYLADVLTPATSAELAYDILTGRLRDSRLIKDFYPESLEVTFPDIRRSANCVIDGELLPLPRELSVRIHKAELKVIGHGRQG